MTTEKEVEPWRHYDYCFNRINIGGQYCQAYEMYLKDMNGGIGCPEDCPYRQTDEFFGDMSVHPLTDLLYPEDDWK